MNSKVNVKEILLADWCCEHNIVVKDNFAANTGQFFDTYGCNQRNADHGSDWNCGKRSALDNVDLVSQTSKDRSASISSDHREEDERTVIDRRISNVNEAASGSKTNAPLDKDFSPSASSWEPSDENWSSDESYADGRNGHMKRKRQNRSVKSNGKNDSMKYLSKDIIMRKFNNKSNVTPTSNSQPILRERLSNDRSDIKSNREIPHKKDQPLSNTIPDSTVKNSLPTINSVTDSVKAIVNDILEMKAQFQKLFKMAKDVKPETVCNGDEPKLNITSYNDNAAHNESEESDKSRSEILDRSDDNVLITNKFRKAATNENKENENSEWIPIGSGKTVIHRSKFEKVKWKSYTIATRTLLLATFKRRILATHSLTGKRSPAFQDKAAKMCLDPKIVSDIIIEVSSRFNIKENLVRNVITTKCADECKMLKTRLKNKQVQKEHRGVINSKIKNEKE